MLRNFANYFIGGNAEEARPAQREANNGVMEAHVVARLRQVDVEGEDWVLVDNNSEGAMAMEESWYVTPPACFTRAGPVFVETSPLEDLLIEHPSMSVYRATELSPIAPDTPPPTPDGQEDVERGIVSPAADRPLMPTPDGQEDVEREIISPAADRPLMPTPTSDSSTAARRYERPTATTGPAIRVDEDGERPNRSRQEKRLVQLRSNAQKVHEKRKTQGLKRGQLARSNKVREVSSVKGKRARRQDRLRAQNSGANNNRKCC